MNDVERALASLLSERVERVTPDPGHRELTLRRARRRRVGNALAAGLVSVAVVAGGVGIAHDREPSPVVGPAAPPERSCGTTVTAGDYGFRSEASCEYPWIATGDFRDTEWEFRAAAFWLEPDAPIRTTLRAQDADGGSGAGLGLEGLDGGLAVLYHDFGGVVFEGEIAGVFGAAAPETETVHVSMEGIEQPIEAHVFEGHDARTALVADYWMAFVPAGTDGRVVARDAGGREIASRVIPRG